MSTISVVIPARDAARTMAACLAALSELNPFPTEIILVDNGSTDETPHIVDSFLRLHPHLPMRFIREPRPGAAAARNAGVHAAKGEIVAFTDADCVVNPRWVAELLDAFSDQSIQAVAANIEGDRHQTLLEKFQAVFTLWPGRTQDAVFQRYTLTDGGFPTANLAVRKQVLDATGGFDETLGYSGEDHDLCRRIYAIGGRIKAIPTATVRHIHRPSVVPFLIQNFRFGQGHAHLLRRSFSKVWRVDLPGWSGFTESIAGHGWIDLTLADKKLVGLLALAWAFPPAGVLVGLYLLRILHQVRAHVRAAGLAVRIPELTGLTGLFLLKCLAIDCGRWYGSARYRVLCV